MTTIQQQPDPDATYVPVGDNFPFGPDPASVICPKCNICVHTYLKYVPGLLTWISVTACIVFIFFPCCLAVPCFVDSCKDVEHYCANCHSKLGTFKRL